MYDAIVTLDISVLLGFAGLNGFKPNTVFLSPCYQFSINIFWAIVDTNGLGLAAPLDDLVQAPDNALHG